jgi:hypothetical protein
LQLVFNFNKLCIFCSSQKSKIKQAMTSTRMHKILTYCIAMVWIANGLFCKVLNLVPRHQQIVARILGEIYARPVTVTIGLAEIGMAIWVLSRIKPRLNAITQIAVVAIMNTLEFFIAPDLLLWGTLNAFFAFLFILLLYYHEFQLNKEFSLNKKT